MAGIPFKKRGDLRATDKETLQAIKNYILSKQVFALFDMAIEKRKKEIGKTAQEINLSKIPNYKEVLSSLAPMVQNRQSPKQIYINPIMRYAINSLSDGNVLEAKDKQAVDGLEFYLTPAVPSNTMYVLPDPVYTGVMAIPRFGFLSFKDIVCLENYADFPESIEEDSLLRLTNIEAPYKITVPQRLIDDYLNI